jgi:hypothetical protein
MKFSKLTVATSLTSTEFAVEIAYGAFDLASCTERVALIDIARAARQHNAIATV